MTFLEDFRTKTPIQQLMFFLGLAFSLLYLGVGLFFIFTEKRPFNMTPTIKLAFGVLLILYSFYRITRVFKQNK